MKLDGLKNGMPETGPTRWPHTTLTTAEIKKLSGPVKVFTAEEIAATDQPIATAENEVRAAHTALELAEGDQHERGLALARALKALRDACKGKDYMKRVTGLGIKYERARYWTDVLEGKRTNRHKDYWLDDGLGVTPNRKPRQKSRKFTLEFETVEDKEAFKFAVDTIGVPATYRAVIDAANAIKGTHPEK